MDSREAWQVPFVQPRPKSFRGVVGGGLPEGVVDVVLYFLLPSEVVFFSERER